MGKRRFKDKPNDRNDDCNWCFCEEFSKKRMVPQFVTLLLWLSSWFSNRSNMAAEEMEDTSERIASYRKNRKNRKIGPVLRIFHVIKKQKILDLNIDISSNVCNGYRVHHWVHQLDHVSFRISQSFSFPDLQRRMSTKLRMTMVTRLGALLRGKRVDRFTQIVW